MVGASIQAAFGADTAPLAKGAAEAQGIVGRFASAAGTALSTMGIALGASAVMGFFKGVIDKAGALQDLSDNLSVGTDALQSFDYAVKQAGGTSEQANAVWEKSKKSLDSLAAGNEATEKQFAAIGLRAKDFVGLNLEQSLERIAQGYRENADKAGAFDAVSDILGTKTAPKLNAVLLQLGSEGFAGFNEAAKEAGQIIEEDTIAKLDEFGDRMAKIGGMLQTAGAHILGWAMKAVDGLGMAAAAVVNRFEGIETVVNRTDFIAEKAAKAVNKALPPLQLTTAELKAQTEIAQERTKLEEFLAKSALEQADHAGKLAELRRQIVEQSLRAVDVINDEATTQRELLKLAQLQDQLRKIEAADRERKLKATRLAKDEEEEFARLSLKSSGSLTAADRQRLDVLTKQREQKRIQFEIDALMEQGVENLSAKDRARLAELFKQRDTLTEQIAAKKQLTAATEEQVAAEKEITAEQRKQFEQSITFKRGRADKDLSDRELAEKRANLRQLVQRDTELRAMGDRYGEMGAYQARGDLEAVEFELARRANFRRDYAQFGEQAFNRYSAFDEQTLRQYIRPEDEKRAQEQLNITRSIDNRLRRIVGE